MVRKEFCESEVRIERAVFVKFYFFNSLEALARENCILDKSLAFLSFNLNSTITKKKHNICLVS